MFSYSTIEEALEELRQGKIILVTDDEGRENEGDLICAAEFATTENINFMATHAKGLICMPMSSEVAKGLSLEQMQHHNTDNHGTAFTVSIDHIDTTTGISAAERSMTAILSVADGAKPEDFRRPGHMFPLVSKEHGVLERDGHTEATVDLCKLAGLKTCGICCEIMAEDGSMMDTPQLIEFAEKHDIKFITIEALQQYRRTHEVLVQCVTTTKLPTKYGDFTVSGYIDEVTGEHHVALYMGDIFSGEPVLTRVHSECLTGDALGSKRCDCGEQYEAAMQKISAEGRGLMLYMRQEGRGIGLINKLRAYALQDQGLDTVEANHALGFKSDLRNYSVAAQILKQMNLGDIKLMTNNPDKIEQLTQYGVNVSERVPIQVEANDADIHYLRTKQSKMRHIINY